MTKIYSKRELASNVHVEWVSKDKQVLSISNDFYFLTQKIKDAVTIKNKFSFGIQELRSSLFCVVVRSLNHTEAKVSDPEILAAHECLKTMELATSKKFSELTTKLREESIQRVFLFFASHEELQGSSVFARLSHQYS